MNRFKAALVLSIAFVAGAQAGPVDDRNPVFNQAGPSAGIVAGNPTGGNLGPGTGNFANGVFVNGQAVGGGLAVPNSCVIGGTGSTLSGVTLGTNLSCTNGTLNATGGGSSLPTSAPLVGSDSGGAGITITPGSGLNIVGSTLVPVFGTTSGTIVQGNDARLSTFTTTNPGIVPAPGTATGKVLSDAGTWINQTGGSLPASAPLLGSNGSAAGITITPTNGLAISGSNLVPTFGSSVNTITQGNDSRLGTIGTVTDGTTTVTGVNQINFTSGVSVTNAGGGVANALITGVGGLPIKQSTNPVQPSVFIGGFAGASAPSNSQFLGSFGPYSAESLNVTTAEFEAVGHNAAIANTSAGGIAFGTSSCAGLVSSGLFCIGLDAGRNYLDIGSGSMAIGNGALGDGAPTNGIIALGNLAYSGAASTITVGAGTPHAGDVITLSVNTTNACAGSTGATGSAAGVINCTTNGSVPVSTWPWTKTYTVQAGDTTATILAASLANAFTVGAGSGPNYILGDGVLEGSHDLFTFQFLIADATRYPTVLKGHYPVRWGTAITMSCTGTCVNSLTTGAGSSGSSSIYIGNNLLQNPTVTNPQFNVIISPGGGPQNFITTASNNVLTGYGVAPNLSTAGQNAIYGPNAGPSITTNGGNSFFGAAAGTGATGQGNDVFGSEAAAGQNCITSGSNNLEIAAGACVPSPTASGQLSIKNILYGWGNTGTGSTASTGELALYYNGATAPAATFTISDAGGTTTNGTHIKVLQTTAPTCTNCTLDAQASDVAGTVTGGTSQTTLTVTFNKTWATAPHCAVSALTSANLTSYTQSTTALVLTTPSLTGAVYNYACVQ